MAHFPSTITSASLILNHGHVVLLVHLKKMEVGLGVHPPKANDPFPPILDFLPLLRIFQSREKFSQLFQKFSNFSQIICISSANIFDDRFLAIRSQNLYFRPYLVSQRPYFSLYFGRFIISTCFSKLFTL